MDNKAKTWIKKLELIKHPEGGWFKEIYRSPELIKQEHLPQRFSGDRNFSTSIYFLLNSGEFSAFHRIRQDEIWYYHDGSPTTLHVIDEKGDYHKFQLGKNSIRDEQPQVVIKAGWIFAASVKGENSFTLAGCNVAPGFDFADFEMPQRQWLLERYPKNKKIILQFTYK
jgi:hypothetical protein